MGEVWEPKEKDETLNKETKPKTKRSSKKTTRKKKTKGE